MNNRLKIRLLLTIALLWPSAVFSLSASNEVLCRAVCDKDTVAVTSNGRLLLIRPGGRAKTLTRRLPIRDIAGMTCYKGELLLLSRQGVILSTADYKSFTAFDFNSTYTGYYGYVRFTAISASDRAVFIAGTYDDGQPAVFESAVITVWSERELSYTKGGQTLMLKSQPTDLQYDAPHDRFIMTCSDGTLFYMPNCSHCNSAQ